MENNAPYAIEEIAGIENPATTLTPEQKDRLANLDWYIDTELPLIQQDLQEVGALQAQWRHSDRMNRFLLEGRPVTLLTES